MTGPSAPDPAVEIVARALRVHDIRWSHAEQTYTCLTCGWTADVDQPLPEYHAGDVVVAALRAAAGTADVYELALVAYRAWYATGAWVAAVRAVLDRLAVTGAPVSVVAGDEDAARAVAAASEPAAADDETVDWLAVGVESLSDQWDEEAGGFMDHEVRRRLEACRDEVRAVLRAVGRPATTGGGGGDVAALSGHACENCQGIAPGSCAFNPHREQDDAVERAAAAVPVSVAAGDDAVERAVRDAIADTVHVASEAAEATDRVLAALRAGGGDRG